jgi:topoisomerase-4 subunit A
MVDLPNEAEIVALFVHVPGRKLLIASTAGEGFVLPEDEILAQTRTGKQALNLKDDARAKVCRPVEGDHVAVVSENANLLCFPTAELPEMTRGKGVRFQRYKRVHNRQGQLEIDGGLADATTFDLARGLTWPMGGGRMRHEPDMSPWVMGRGGIGRKPPHGFPKPPGFGELPPKGED